MLTRVFFSKGALFAAILAIGALILAVPAIFAGPAPGQIADARDAARSTATVTGVGTEPLAMPASSIEVVRDPRGALAQRLNQEFGVNCFVLSKHLRSVDTDLDARITLAGGDERWLTAGKEWVGASPDEAVYAFGATWAGRTSSESGEIWMQVTRDGADIGVQLRATRTPSGFIVWQAVDLIAEADCRDD